MDGHGWVSIDVVIPFKRMKVLGATKELVVEAAYHSTVIEIDHAKQDKIRVTKLWREYVSRRRSDKDKAKERRSQSNKVREREKAKRKQQGKDKDKGKDKKDKDQGGDADA